MTYMYIGAIDGYTPTERTKAISRELFNISRPLSLKSENDKTEYLFDWKEHPTAPYCALVVDKEYIVKVHPSNNLDALVALFPELTDTEKNNLAGYIQMSSSFPFKNIMPSTSNVLTAQQLEDLGFII